MEVKTLPPSSGGDHSLEDSNFDILDPILKALKQEGIKFGKQIVYIPLKWCGQLHYRAQNEHKIESNVQGGELESLLSQYHSPQSQHVRYNINILALKLEISVRSFRN